MAQSAPPSPLDLYPPDAPPPPHDRGRLIWRLRDSRALAAARRTMLAGCRATYRMPARLVALPIREELGFMLNARGLTGCGVEVGVRDGWFSEMLLDRWRGRHLISVDPWREFGADEYKDLSNVEQARQDELHRATGERLARFGERSSIWRMTGSEAAERLPHHSLDLVYLDARHDYDSVMSDLAEWHERLRPGGVIAGHDYVDGDFVDGLFGVESAVNEFFGARGLRVRATFADPPWFSWWVQIPRA
jgi:hypothetical protein